MLEIAEEALDEKCFRFEPVEQRHRLRDVGRLTRCQRQGDGISERVDDRVDLGRQPAARSADGLILADFFWAPALC